MEEFPLSHEPVLVRARMIFTARGTLLEDGAVEVRRGRIVDLGPYPELKRTFRGRRVDLGEVLLLPALTNAHTHLELSALRFRLTPTGSFITWVRSLIRKRVELSLEDLRQAAAEALDELWQEGVGLLGEVGNTGITLGLLHESPFHAVYFREIIDFRGKAEIKQFLHQEKAIGEIKYVQVCRYGIRGSIGKRSTPLPIPKEVNYNLWLGPAEDQVLYRNKLHYDWHWDWNTGSGEMGNWCVHVLDDVRNVVFQDEVTLPKRIVAGGGRVVWNDAGNTPNVHFAYFDTGKIPTYIGLSNLPAKPGEKGSLKYRGVTTGYFVQCEGGYYMGRRGGGAAYDTAGKKIRGFSGGSGSSHAQNFIDAIRANDSSLLRAEIKVGHDSTGWCNLANIGFRAGSRYSLDQAREISPDDANWNALLSQMTNHLKAHGYSMSNSEIRLSPVLHHNPQTEQFTGEHAEAANAFLKRKYRKEFEVPADV